MRSDVDLERSDVDLVISYVDLVRSVGDSLNIKEGGDDL